MVHIIISYNLPDINIVEAIIQIEIDESLKALYTRSDKGSIQVYDLSSDGKTVTKVAEMSSTSITKTAANILKYVDCCNSRDSYILTLIFFVWHFRACNIWFSFVRTVDQSNFQNIVSISAVSKDESFDIQLVAVTEAGRG